MKQVFSAAEFEDVLKKTIANKIGEEQAYLLEEKLSIEFRNLEEHMQNIADAINDAINENLQDELNQK